MIDQLRGVLVEAREGGVVVDVGGVGYWVSTPQGSIHPESGDEVVRVFTHLHVREDAMDLFGFGTRQERELFRVLVSVSGVGPKVALTILSDFMPEQLQAAVLSSDVAALKRIKGIGQKVAERLILELKGKLDHLDLAPPEAAISIGATQQSAYLALTQTLGFGAIEARRALEQVREEGDTTEALIKKSLSFLAGR
jgi:Holliday junction DNA helicase RuvA